MMILINVIMLALFAIVFYAGKKTADGYNEEIIRELQYQLQIMAAQKGVGFIAPPVRRRVIGDQFMDKLKKDGRAIQRFTPSDN